MMNKSIQSMPPYYPHPYYAEPNRPDAGSTQEAEAVNLHARYMPQVQPSHKVSLGAIFCGVAVSMMLLMAMNMLGLSLGVHRVNPMQEAESIEVSLNTLSILWASINILASLFIGGWMAGRLASTWNHVNSVLHGVVTWAVVTILLLLLIGSPLGSLLNGVGQVLHQGTAILTGGVVSRVPEVVSTAAAEQAMLTAITDELHAQLLMSAQSPHTALSVADVRISQAVIGLVTHPQVISSPQYRAQHDALAAQWADHLSVSISAADAQLATWRDAYQDVRIEAENTARKAAQTVSNTLTTVSGILFCMMFMGVAAAGVGAYLAVAWHDDVPQDPKHAGRLKRKIF